MGRWRLRGRISSPSRVAKRQLLHPKSAASHAGEGKYASDGLDTALKSGASSFTAIVRTYARRNPVSQNREQFFTGVRKLVLGSTTERVLRDTTTPVLLTPPTSPGPVSVEDATRLIGRIVAQSTCRKRLIAELRNNPHLGAKSSGGPEPPPRHARGTEPQTTRDSRPTRARPRRSGGRPWSLSRRRRRIAGYCGPGGPLITRCLERSSAADRARSLNPDVQRSLAVAGPVRRLLERALPMVSTPPRSLLAAAEEAFMRRAATVGVLIAVDGVVGGRTAAARLQSHRHGRSWPKGRPAITF